MLNNHIDFDEASIEWRKNKKKTKNGQFEYICSYIHTNGKQCRKTILASGLNNNYICKYDKYQNHPDKNYYCKRHISRYNQKT